MILELPPVYKQPVCGQGFYQGFGQIVLGLITTQSMKQNTGFGYPSSGMEVRLKFGFNIDGLQNAFSLYFGDPLTSFLTSSNRIYG